MDAIPIIPFLLMATPVIPLMATPTLMISIYSLGVQKFDPLREIWTN